MGSPRDGIRANPFGQPGRLSVEHAPRGLGCDVPRSEARASCCQNEQRSSLVDEAPDSRGDLSGIIGDDDSSNVESLRTEELVEHIAARILPHACMDAVGHGQDRCVHTGSFVFSTSSTSPITMSLSTAFAMS